MWAGRPFLPDSNSLDAARAGAPPRMLPGRRGLGQSTQGEKTNPSSRMTGLYSLADGRRGLGSRRARRCRHRPAPRAETDLSCGLLRQPAGNDDDRTDCARSGAVSSRGGSERWQQPLSGIPTLVSMFPDNDSRGLFTTSGGGYPRYARKGAGCVSTHPRRAADRPAVAWPQ